MPAVCTPTSISPTLEGFNTAAHMHLQTVKPPVSTAASVAMTGQRRSAHSLAAFQSEFEARGVEGDYRHLADQRGTVLHIPVSARLGEGYGKRADWVYDSSDATLAATSRSHVGYLDDTVGLYDKRSRGLAIRDAAHAVDLDWRGLYASGRTYLHCFASQASPSPGPRR